MRIQNNQIILEDSSGASFGYISAGILPDGRNGITIAPYGDLTHTLYLGTPSARWKSISMNGQLSSPLLLPAQDHRELGKCSLCHQPAFIQRPNNTLYCDICYLAFTRAPELDRLITAWQRER